MSLIPHKFSVFSTWKSRPCLCCGTDFKILKLRCLEKIKIHSYRLVYISNLIKARRIILEQKYKLCVCACTCVCHHPNNLRTAPYLPVCLLLTLAGSKIEFRKEQKQKPITKTQRQAQRRTGNFINPATSCSYLPLGTRSSRGSLSMGWTNTPMPMRAQTSESECIQGKHRV